MDTKIISFNSYKGGACRTTTCYNSVPFLAKKLKATAKNPILLFDMDLDSMGLTNLISANKFDEPHYSSNVLFQPDETRNNAFRKARNFEDPYFTKNFIPVGKKFGLEDDKSVLFLGVANNQRNISEKEFSDMNAALKPTPIAKLVNDVLLDDDRFDEEDRPAAILFDCASGIQNTTLLLLRLVDKFVVCMRPTVQFRIGTSQYIINQIPSQFRAVAKKKRECVLLPTAVSDLSRVNADSEEAISELLNFRMVAHRDIKNIVGDNYDNQDYFSINDDLIEKPDNMGIPEVDRFKWREGLLYQIAKDKGIENLPRDEQNAYSRYEQLADILAD